jgi:hypothetical protein
VVIVNESFVRHHLAGQDPLGKRLGVGETGAPIVGVVSDVRHWLTQEAAPQFFVSSLQFEEGIPFMSLAVRTRGDPLKLVAAVRNRILSVDKDQPVYSVMTLEQRLADTLRFWRTNMSLSSALGALALGLAGLGI